MKTKYHIIIDVDDRHSFENCLRRLGADFEYICRTGDGLKNERHYYATLSKYELLYLRLSCKTGKIIDIDEYMEQYERQKDHASA